MSLEEILFNGTLALGGMLILALLWSLLPIPKALRRKLGWSLLAVLAMGGAVAADYVLRPTRSITANLPPPSLAEAGIATSQSCQACHPGQFESWHKTFHRTMTQPASAHTIVGAFDGRTLRNYGETAQVEQRGTEFWVEMIDPDWQRQVLIANKHPQDIPQAPRAWKQVVMSTGSHTFQTYWVRSEKGRDLIQFPWRWYIPEKRWMHRYDVFLAPDLGRVALAEYDRVWNRDCSNCHSVATHVGFNQTEGYFTETRVGELGISCEACHGPAAEHVAANRDPIHRYRSHWSGAGDQSIVNPRKLTARKSAEICGQCHSHSNPANAEMMAEYDIKGRLYRAGGDLYKYVTLHHSTSLLTQHPQTMFWADGTERAAGREFNGLIDSPCFQKGTMSCLSCHSMHAAPADDQLAPRMETNAACTQCHPQYQGEKELTAHTHHAGGSSGSLCYNCHMPHTSFGLLKAVRSHRIEIPQVAPVGPEQRPNGCNLCHLDKSLGWTAETLEAWYGMKPVPLSEEEQQIAAGALWLLRGDAAQRALAAWHARWQPAVDIAGTGWLTPLLVPLLDDPYPVVRNLGWWAVRTLPAAQGLEYVHDLPPEQRATVQRQIHERYAALPPPPNLGIRPGLQALFDSQDRPRDKAIEAILRRRDNHPVAVNE